MIGFDLAQTFFVDKEAVQKAERIFITSVDLFFKTKPTAGETKTGIVSPGVSVFLCPLDEKGTPDLQAAYLKSQARVEYANIVVSTTGSSTAQTTFTFSRPVVVTTNKQYAFLVKFDGSDPDFSLWYNKAGVTNVLGTAATQVSSGKVDGSLYRVTNGQQLTAETDADLAFRVKIARFTSNTATFAVINRPSETLKLANVVSTFKGGELAYVTAANATGTITTTSTSNTILGSGTTFDTTVVVGDYIVITDGTPGNTNIRTVTSRANSTVITVDATPSFSNSSAHYYKTVIGRVLSYNGLSDVITLQDVNSNSSLYVSTGTTLNGVDSQATANISSILSLSINSVVPSYNILAPVGSSIVTKMTFANTAGSVDSANEQQFQIGKRLFITNYPAMFDSRTNEVQAVSPYHSFQSTINMTSTNEYTSPVVAEEDLDVFIEQYDVNNDTTNEYLGRGNSKSRYVSKTVSLTKDQLAEDLKVYVTAFQPANSSVKVYARFRNSLDVETLETKNWTELSLDTGSLSVLSNPANPDDMIELTYSVPTYGAATLATGQFTTSSGNAVVVGTSGAVNTDISIGSLVRVYSPSIPSSYIVDNVIDANTTTFTLGRAISNSSIVGTGFLVEKITRTNSGYLDIQNKNVLTYFNSAMSKYQGYDSFAIKVVLLSSDGVQTPFVDDVRAIAVSA
jgi:hypothetical protein